MLCIYVCMGVYIYIYIYICIAQHLCCYPARRRPREPRCHPVNNDYINSNSTMIPIIVTIIVIVTVILIISLLPFT